MRVKSDVRLKQLESSLSMPKDRLNVRCEIAMHRGYVIPIEPEDVLYTLEYVASAVLCRVGKEDSKKEVAQNILDEVLLDHKLSDIRFYCINTIYGYPMISLLINVDEDDYSVLPDDACDLVKIPEHMINGYGYWYSYTYSFLAPEFSEFGDIFLEEVGGGYVHRVS